MLDGHLHLTLRFFAELPADRVEAVSAAADAAAGAVPAFDLEVRGLGRFPPHGPLRVVWAGLGEGREPLLALAGALARELETRGFPPEERPFSPHLTLARCRDPRGSKRGARAVAAYAPSAGWFGATVSTLFRSRTPRVAHGVRSPVGGGGRPRSDSSSAKMFRSDGGGVTPAGTEKQSPIACPRPW